MHISTGLALTTEQSLCPLKMLTGFPCPGCGITKSLVFLYEGNLYSSLYYHLFGPLVILFSIGTIVVLTAELLTGRVYLQQLLFNRRLGYALGIALAVYHLLRLVYFISTNSWDSIMVQSVWR